MSLRVLAFCGGYETREQFGTIIHESVILPSLSEDWRLREVLAKYVIKGSLYSGNSGLSNSLMRDPFLLTWSSLFLLLSF
jgi:hypothetical protein